MENFAVKEELTERDLVNTPELKPRQREIKKKNYSSVIKPVSKWEFSIKCAEWLVEQQAEEVNVTSQQATLGEACNGRPSGGLTSLVTVTTDSCLTRHANGKAERLKFRWRRRLLVISAPNDEDWAYSQQLSALSGQACSFGLRHITILKLLGVGEEVGGVLELFPINGSSAVEREDVAAHLVKDIRNYFQVSPEYFSMLLVGKDGNVKSWYPSPVWSMVIVYDLIDSMQLRRQEMAIQQSLGMRCPEEEYAGYGYHSYHQGYRLP
ncbi:hypothetical protein P7K49_031246 [Saguinus oedipus]|uniref:Coiled-coil domain-containing protein 80 n=1 Tax=Saguinus oedipus TaxID=9490 RepID=A0ABQ9U4H8_SAGOE|nr:hypothetical protein P7K49_031246 [Saguinus oedipus]